MTGEIGKKFLKDYFLESDPLFGKYMRRKIKSAGLVGNMPKELLKRFYETAKKGKKIRGALVVLAYSIFGGKDKRAIVDTSLFLELFHAGVLVHDDVMDEDNTRRGLVSIHKQFKKIGKEIKVKTDPSHYGESMAYGVGDGAFYLSWEKLLKSPFPAKTIIEAGKIYSEYVLKVVYGQVLDITNVPLDKISKRDVLEVMRYKTAEYTGVLPLLCGATLAGSTDKNKISALENYGKNFGWAFQIQDDILGMFAKEEKLGKPVGSDLREGKNTLLMLYLLKNGNTTQKEFQRKVLGNKNITKLDIQKMQEMLKSSGAYKYVIDLGWEHVKNGIEEIPKITPSKKYSKILESLITYMMERTL